MTQSITDTDTLTLAQELALTLVEARPGLTVEDYAEGDEDLCNALYWLKYNGYIVIDPITNAVTVKG